MKKSVDCKLKNIKSLNDVTYADYALYKKISEINKHPHINKNTVSGAGTIILGLAILGISIVTVAFISWIGVMIALGGAIPLINGIEDAVDELNENRTLLKQYKALKKSKDWQRIEDIMLKYEFSDAFEEDKKAYEIETLQQNIANKKMEILSVAQKETNHIAKINTEISLINKKLEELKAKTNTKPEQNQSSNNQLQNNVTPTNNGYADAVSFTDYTFYNVTGDDDYYDDKDYETYE